MNFRWWGIFITCDKEESKHSYNVKDQVIVENSQKQACQQLPHTNEQ